MNNADVVKSAIQRMMMEGDEDNSSPSISDEGKLARLQEALTAYGKINTYVVGDLVTPLKSSPVKGAGEPHIVVKSNTFKTPTDIPQHNNAEGGSWITAVVNDLVVLTFMDNVICPFAMASYMVEPWVLPGSEPHKQKF